MNLKVFQIAKELGINSKLLVKRLQAEGIPKIETHMSTVSIGLAEQIRELHKNGKLASLLESTKGADIQSLNSYSQNTRHFSEIFVPVGRFPFMVRIKTKEEAVLYCLRALSMFAQSQGETTRVKGASYKPWKGTGYDEWEFNDGEVTFKFSAMDKRKHFEKLVNAYFSGKCDILEKYPDE